jgi:hypothetical protein
MGFFGPDGCCRDWTKKSDGNLRLDRFGRCAPASSGRCSAWRIFVLARLFVVRRVNETGARDDEPALIGEVACRGGVIAAPFISGA